MPEPKKDSASAVDDDYLAQLLSKDARDCSLRYSALGVYGPTKRSSNGAPKPNTRFLKNILRATDNHNANLKKKEEEEARERIRTLDGERYRPSRPSHSSERGEPEYKRRRTEHSGRDDERHRLGDRDRRRHGDRSRRRPRESDDDDGKKPRARRRHHKDHRSDTDEHLQKSEALMYERTGENDRRTPRSGSPRSSHLERTRRGRPISSSDRNAHRRGGGRSHSRSRSPSKLGDHRQHGKERAKNGAHKVMHNQSHKTSTNTQEDSGFGNIHYSSKDQRRSPSCGDIRSSSDSDPLSDLIGPAPPPMDTADSEKTPRPRGRGAYGASNSSNIDAHFSSNYDPALDIRLEDDHNSKDNLLRPIRPVPGLLNPKELDKDLDDDWDMALEALRDREIWKRKGADRLRAAGFEDDVVEKWEASKAFSGLDSGNSNANSDNASKDIKWTKRGEGREWDRGKQIDEDGHVSFKPSW